MPGVPVRFKTSKCTKCAEPITDVQFEQCLGFCEVCHRNYFDELVAEEKDPEIRDRLLTDLQEAQREFDDEDTYLDPEDQDGYER